jgi:hypothetical protein
MVPEGGSAFVYFSDVQTASQIRERVIELFKGREGIADVITPDQFFLWMPSPTGFGRRVTRQKCCYGCRVDPHP